MTTPVVVIDGEQVTPLFAGLTATIVSLYAVVVTIPPDIAPGDVLSGLFRCPDSYTTTEAQISIGTSNLADQAPPDSPRSAIRRGTEPAAPIPGTLAPVPQPLGLWQIDLCNLMRLDTDSEKAQLIRLKGPNSMSRRSPPAVLLAVFVIAVPAAWSQAVISARSGMVNYVEGSVQPRGPAGKARQARFSPTSKSARLFPPRRDTPRVLLTPGVF